jgi:DNA recombination protein RmuC
MLNFNFDDPNLIILLSICLIIVLLLGYGLQLWQSKRLLSAELKKQQIVFEDKQRMLESQYLNVRETSAQQAEEIISMRSQQMLTQKRLGELEQQAEQIKPLKDDLYKWQKQAQFEQRRSADLKAELEAKAARYQQKNQSSEEKIQLLEMAEKRLQEQFENLANKIFEQKNANFAETSKAGLDALLSPLKEQIEGFKKQVTDQYVKEGQERASLKTEILGLKELNQQITAEASALTRALKGDNKKQGNWGEVVLERILKESGLREGHEFDSQVSLKNTAGKIYQPDVVVHLPNDKDIVIDSKMSLAAYERYFNEQEDNTARHTHLLDHIQSLKNHIRELGKKDYQELKGIRTLDYVLMFIPVESAFLLAIDKAPELITLAIDNNIMIVSPTNLLVALRTVNNIWQYEYQSQNAQKIAMNAAKLYDKFHGFMADLEKVGKSLETSQKHYDAAFNKLSSGKGNIVRQIEQFRTLGVQSTKKLDSETIEKAKYDEDENL